MSSTNRIRTCAAHVAALVATLSPVAAAQTRAPAAGRQIQAVDAIIDRFADHQVVVIGEIHRSAQVHRFLGALITDPRFRQRVDDIVVEFGNARYQDLADRYVGGGSVPEDSLQLVWRNTTQLLVWDSPLYRRFFDLVRAENSQHRGGKQLRVLLGDPPIDWAQVTSLETFPRAYGYRDPDTFRILETHSISQGRRALVIIGNHHLPRRSPVSDFKPADLGEAGVGDALQQQHPGKAYLIWTVDHSTPRVLKQIRKWQPGTIRAIAETPFDTTTSGVLFGSVTVFRMVNGKRTPVHYTDADFPPLGEQVDALLYLGPVTTEVDPPASLYRDTAYVRELRRRSEIVTNVFGVDFASTIDDLVAKARRR
ncbi:MAG: hypothetical protein V4558_05830 [Gemmatimonadota bacterium]